MLLPAVVSLILQIDGGVSQFAKRLRSPVLREPAACEALQLLAPSFKGDDEQCAVNHVIETVGPRGKPAFLVFFAHKWNEEGGPGKPVGHFEVFDSAGSHVTWFMNANVLETTDRVFQVGKGPAVIVQEIEHQPSCGQMTRDAWAVLVQTIYVISLAEPERPMLSLLVGPPTRETYLVRKLEPAKKPSPGEILFTGQEVAPAFTWSWSADCSASSCDVSIGPKQEPREQSVVFRWKVGSRNVEGPSGSADGGFLRYEIPNERKAIDAFSDAHGFPTNCEGARDASECP